MKTNQVVPFVVVAFLLTGCLSSQTTRVQPEITQPVGAYVHAPSGMRFPAEVGDFHRVDIIKYDAAGLDVSAGYDLTTLTGGVAATVYVYPAPPLVSIGSPADVVASARARLCKGEFERRKSEVAASHLGARLTEEKEVPPVQGSASTMGRMATFEFQDLFWGRRQPLQSELYVFCPVGQRWAFEYRFTSPKGFEARGKISEFLAKLQWTISSI